MGLLSFLFGGRPDPTLEWPLSTGPAPEFDIAAATFGPLKFDAPLDDARFLGRPDAAQWKSGKVLKLLWARWGLELEFIEGRLAFIAWIIGPDPFEPSHRDLRFAHPRPVGGPALDGRTTEADLVAWLGPHERRDSDPDETILEWVKNGLVHEFELTPAGSLKRWNVYEE